MGNEVEKITLYTGNEIILFESQKEIAYYLDIKSADRNSIKRRCRVLDYEVDFPLRKNEKPLK